MRAENKRGAHLSKTCLVGRRIDVSPNQNGAYISAIVKEQLPNVPMDVSRESQRSRNISEVEESAEVRNTSSQSFLLSVGYFAFLIFFYCF